MGTDILIRPFVIGQGVMVFNQKKVNSDQIQGTIFFYEGGETLEQHCPQKWWMPHPQKHSRLDRTGHWAT